MSTIAVPDRSPATSSRSAAALNLIGGTWVEGRGNTNRDICNPADTAEVLAKVREAAPEQVDEACAAAARAFPGWRATPAPERAHVLFDSGTCWKISSRTWHTASSAKTAIC